MKLSTLLKGIGWKGRITQDVEITGITEHSDQIKQGMLFVCIKGRHEDGHRYAAQAAGRGAAAILAQRALQIQNVPTLQAEDTRKAYALLCARFYGNSAQRLTITGITGTNGKTSTAWLLSQLLEQAGMRTGLAGTIENRAGSYREDAPLTTLEPPAFHRLLGKMEQQGCTHAVAEVSSQALAQKRLYGILFSCAVFTNLTQEHLDYHGTMEEYYLAKRSLFEACRCAVVNIDDPWGARLTREIGCRTLTVSSKYPSATYYIEQMRTDAKGMHFALMVQGKRFSAFLPLYGEYNVYNAVCAVACAAEQGVPVPQALSSLAGVCPIKGRMEALLLGKDFQVIIDYAHTPDGLQKALQALRSACAGRLVCLFGCGGNRDKTKRPVMGKIAAQNSDFVYITSDNPRQESPGAIIRDILSGLAHTNTPFEVIENREEAIFRAIRSARKGDMILLAGKGHEEYQIRKEGTVPFHEREIAARAAGICEL